MTNKHVMTFEEYAWGQDWLTNWFEEMYWEGGIRTDELYEAVIKEAIKDNIDIIDADTCDYDGILFDMYQNTELGLS